jgi:hypothetical protein
MRAVALLPPESSGTFQTATHQQALITLKVSLQEFKPESGYFEQKQHPSFSSNLRAIGQRS